MQLQVQGRRAAIYYILMSFIINFHVVTIVGSVKVIFLSYRYRADKSTIFGMRGLWVLTINSGRGAMLKYL